MAIDGRKNGSSRTPVTTATANEYPAIRPNTAAQRSSGSRRSTSANEPPRPRSHPLHGRATASRRVMPASHHHQMLLTG